MNIKMNINMRFCLLLLISMIPLITIIMFAFLAICRRALIGYLLCLYLICLIFPPIIAIVVMPPLMVIGAHCKIE